MKLSYRNRNLVIGLGVIYLIRVIILFSMGLMPQDAYYYYYAKHLALSYYDHPPMIAYVLKFFTLLLGKKVFVLKLADFCISLLTVLAFYQLSLGFLSKGRAFNASVLLGSTLLVTVISIVSTPDVPLMLLWTISLILISKAVFESNLWSWVGAGFMMGLAFDSKYTAAFLWVGVVLFLVMSRPHRKYLFSWNFFLMLISFGMTILPVIIWNHLHHWGSFGFQGSDRILSILRLKFRPQLTLGLMAHQFILLLPVLFIGLFGIWWRFIKKGLQKRHWPSSKVLFLFCFSIPMILFFTVLSPVYWIKLNWLMPAYLSAVIWISTYLKVKTIRWQLGLSIVLHLVLCYQIVFYPVNIRSDDTWVGWDDLAKSVQEIQNRYPDHFLFSTDGYKTSAILSFYFPQLDVYAANVLNENGLQFSITDSCLTKLDRMSAIYVDSETRLLNDQRKGSHDKKLDRFFEAVTELDPIVIKDLKGKILRKFYIYRCTGYQSHCSAARAEE